MLSNVEYPDCTCGKNRWNPGGGQFSPNFQQTNGVCGACGRVGVHLMHPGGVLYIVPKGLKMTDDHDKWFNGVMFPVWRIEENKIDKARREFEEKQWQAFAREHEVDPYVPPREWPEDIRKVFHKVADEYMKTDGYLRPLGYHPCPLPPRLPEDLAAWIGDYSTGKLTWVPVDHALVRNLPVPEDPTLTWHMAYWGRVFTAVEALLGEALPERTKIPNQYYNDSTNHEPWFTFIWHGKKVVVGPRKRVNVVELSNPTPTARDFVERMGKKDDTTHDVRDDRVMMHAWGDVKTVEYLVNLLRAA